MTECKRCGEKYSSSNLNVGVCGCCLSVAEKKKILENRDRKYILKDKLGNVFTVRDCLEFSEEEIENMPTNKVLEQFEGVRKQWKSTE